MNRKILHRAKYRFNHTLNYIKFYYFGKFNRTLNYIKHYYFGRYFPKSIYFYTLHKCASTLFSDFVLKNVNELLHVDYASQIYNGEIKIGKQLTFKENGFIYGPLRILPASQTPMSTMLIAPITENEFIRGKTAIFFIRDPRDILVSSYYSFGFTHGLSLVKEIRERQEINKKNIQALSLDEYVIKNADNSLRNFEVIDRLSILCEHRVILKYEDMIENFDHFSTSLRKYIPLDENILNEIYERSRPKQKENNSLHRRSGKAGGFRDTLTKSTIEILNQKLGDILTRFDYEI